MAHQKRVIVQAPLARFGENFINPQVLAAEALDQLDYELVAGNLMYRDRTEDFANVRGMKVGDFISVRTATDFFVDEFDGTSDINTQQISQSSSQLQITKHFDVSIEIGSKERALNLDGIRTEVINPAMTSMAQKIDTFLFSVVNLGARGAYYSDNLLGNASDIALARAQANVQQIAKVNRVAVVSNDLEATLLGTDVFHKFDTRGTPAIPALAEANLGRLMGMDWYSSVNFDVVSVAEPLQGTASLTDNDPLANNQGSKILNVSALQVGFTAGSLITIAGAKRGYHVAVDASAGDTEIQLVEEIDEELSQLGAAAVTASASSAHTYEGVIMNPGAYSFAAPPLDDAAGDKSGVASAAGMSIRMTEAYDIKKKKTYWSFDMLIGAAAIDGRLAMALASNSPATPV